MIFSKFLGVPPADITAKEVKIAYDRPGVMQSL